MRRKRISTRSTRSGSGRVHGNGPFSRRGIAANRRGSRRHRGHGELEGRRCGCQRRHDPGGGCAGGRRRQARAGLPASSLLFRCPGSLVQALRLVDARCRVALLPVRFGHSLEPIKKGVEFGELVVALVGQRDHLPHHDLKRRQGGEDAGEREEEEE
jgi:hypothetical protein